MEPSDLRAYFGGEKDAAGVSETRAQGQLSVTSVCRLRGFWSASHFVTERTKSSEIALALEKPWNLQCYQLLQCSSCRQVFFTCQGRASRFPLYMFRLEQVSNTRGKGIAINSVLVLEAKQRGSAASHVLPTSVVPAEVTEFARSLRRHGQLQTLQTPKLRPSLPRPRRT